MGCPFPLQICAKHALLGVLFLFACLSAAAQSIENRYRTHYCNGGVTYFFCPKQLKHTQHVEGFTFDMTYHTSGDSVFVNFTLLTAKPVNVDSVVMRNAGSGHGYAGKNLTTLYYDVRGKRCEIRTTSKFAFADIRRVFAGETALRFEMILDDGTPCSAVYGHSQWSKERRQIKRILELIDYQRK